MGSILCAQTVWERKGEEKKGGRAQGNAVKDTRLHLKPRPHRKEEEKNQEENKWEREELWQAS